MPVRYDLVLWLFVLSAMAFLDRTNISIPGIQIGQEFKIDNTHLGWVFSAFLIGYAAFQVPSGILATRFGPRRVLTFGVLWWGAFTVMTALARRRFVGPFSSW
jgi:ACS family glucarate transporter-like MFS transporter